jgi:hypothetical protein
VTATDDALAQLNVLLGEYDKIAPQVRQPGGRELPLGLKALTNRLQAAIERLTMPSSTYAQAAKQQQQYNRGFGALLLTELASIATALRDDIMAGWLASVLELAHADTYNDYLEMAEGLYGQGYKDPAAVIAGASLEVHLRTLATNHGISLQAANGSPKKADTMNVD